MDCSRRDLALFFAAATAAMAQSPAALPSKMYRFEDLAVRANGANKSRSVLRGKTHTGFALQVHQTELAPGQMPHAAHSHKHEEMIFVREGTMEVTMGKQTQRLGPGSVAFVASGEEHGWKNVGSTRAHYFVLALNRADQA
jgi:quercetin dioxygenase-like cupin family protein